MQYQNITLNIQTNYSNKGSIMRVGEIWYSKEDGYKVRIYSLRKSLIVKNRIDVYFSEKGASVVYMPEKEFMKYFTKRKPLKSVEIEMPDGSVFSKQGGRWERFSYGIDSYKPFVKDYKNKSSVYKFKKEMLKKHY